MTVRDLRWLPLELIEAFVPEMRARGVSTVARSARGFLPQYRRAGGDPDRVSDAWADKRAAFLARHLAEAKANGEPWFDADGAPTRRHLALVAWAYSPQPKRLALRAWPAKRLSAAAKPR